MKLVQKLVGQEMFFSRQLHKVFLGIGTTDALRNHMMRFNVSRQQSSSRSLNKSIVMQFVIHLTLHAMNEV